MKKDVKHSCSSNNGSHVFQLDLDLALIEEGIKIDWREPFQEDGSKICWYDRKSLPTM
jgi:hypothetical protein